jgi:hypothetical protein
MKSIFETCQPRDDVRKGQLSEDAFAARLKDVMNGTAAPAYQDPDLFFENTFPTDGLRTLLREVLGRLTGSAPTNNPIIRLETSFGGGKTHNLISLYHAVKGKVSEELVRPYLGNEVSLPRPGAIDVAGVVGSDLDPSTGIYHPEDNVMTYTLWGEIAYQLGGRSGYALAQESDKNRSAPGTGLFERIIGDRPTLILIDEIARHFRAASTVPTATGQSNLAEQTVAFLMSLMEYVASQKRVVLVLTMASEADAFQNETAEMRQALSEALKISARQERVLTPTGESEIAAIVVHRLFASVDRATAEETVRRYGDYYHTVENSGAHVHERALRADYLHEFSAAYPFHPELIRALSLRVGTIPNFQRTRGALRLLATVVRELWQQQPPDAYMIHPFHVDLGISAIVEDMTSRLDRPRFKQVSEADIVSLQQGIPAHASEADEPLVASGKPSYARRCATTIFLHSLTQGVASGIEMPDLLLSVLSPTESGGDDPAVVQRALERLYEKAWFLEYDGYRYRFQTEPSLNKIIDDETGSIGWTRAKQEIDERIKKIWSAGFLKPVYFPAAPADLDDDAGPPKLAIVHYDAEHITSSQDAPPNLVRKLYERTGLTETFRSYQNNVLFLVADADQIGRMIEVARRYLAIVRITDSVERMRQFNEDNQKKLRKLKGTTELDVRVAITKTYKFLFYPSSDAPKENTYLRREMVPPQEQGETNTDQTNVVVKVLDNLQKVRKADDPLLPAAFIKIKTWGQNQVEMTTEEMRRSFARKISLPILLDLGQLRRSIENGVKTQQWIYYDPAQDFAYDHESPPTTWQISEDARLYSLSEAKRLNLRIKGKWQPTAPDPTPGGDQPDTFEDPPDDLLDDLIQSTRLTRIQGSGIPNQAFQQIFDKAHELEANGIKRLDINFNGLNNKGRISDLKAIGLAVPQMGKARYGIVLKLSIEFPEENEHMELTFQGGWDRYKRLKQVSDAFASESERANIDFHLVVDFDGVIELGNTQLVTIQQILSQMSMGPVQLSAELSYPS